MKRSNNGLLSAQEFAQRTGIAVPSVRRLLREGKLNGIKKSGKWQIPEEQLKYTDSAPQTHPANPEQNQNPPQDRFLTIDEFSEMTYLTENGIIQWLQTNRLIGKRGPDGTWQVNEKSLQLNHLRHLIRG